MYASCCCTVQYKTAQLSFGTTSQLTASSGFAPWPSLRVMALAAAVFTAARWACMVNFFKDAVFFVAFDAEFPTAFIHSFFAFAFGVSV